MFGMIEISSVVAPNKARVVVPVGNNDDHVWCNNNVEATMKPAIAGMYNLGFRLSLAILGWDVQG